MNAFLYFWSGNANSNNTIPEGNYNGIKVSNTNLVTGGNEGHGVNYSSFENSSYKGRPYQKISFPSTGNFSFTLGSSNADTLIIRYIRLDSIQEEIYKKKSSSNEKFILEITNGRTELVRKVESTEIVYNRIETGYNPY